MQKADTDCNPDENTTTEISPPIITFTVLTLFPELVRSLFLYSIIKNAVQKRLICAETLDIRLFASGKHHVTDDIPYGGGCGMVMKPEPLTYAIRETKNKHPDSLTVLLSPQGRIFDQNSAKLFAKSSGLILVCGRYEGVDERITKLIDIELSIGDYVLTGGELAAMVVIDAVTRLIPGVLGGEESARLDSFFDGMIEHAHYTRPPVFENDSVPDVLLSGNHKKIEQWRRESSMIRTFIKRPDLLMNHELYASDMELLNKWKVDIERIISSKSICCSDASFGSQ